MGPGRLVADGVVGTSKPVRRWLATHLYTSGAGVFAAAMDRTQDSEDRGTYDVDDERLTAAILSGLQYLGRHARDRAAASGNAQLQVSMHPVSGRRPLRLVHHRAYGITEAISREQVVTMAPVNTVADVDDLATGGAELVAAAYRLGSGVAQSFGAAESLQLTPDGQLRRPYWSTSSWRPGVEAWAAPLQVDWTDELL